MTLPLNNAADGIPAPLTAELLLPDLTDAERARMRRVEAVLPIIAEAASARRRDR